MTRSKALAVGAIVLFSVALLPGVAAAQQSLSLNIGGFVVRGESGRVAGDTLVADLSAGTPFALDFRIQDFNNVTFGGEWLIGVGNFLEGGVGVSYYVRTVPSVYRDLVNNDGTEIQQDLRLRIVPITATVRLLPLGRHAAVQPYLGAGVGLFAWRYSETGEFVDSSQNIFRANFVGSGTTAGPVILGGVRFPVSTGFALGGEVRYQKADGSLSTDFLGDKIDLGGVTYQVNFILRF